VSVFTDAMNCHCAVMLGVENKFCFREKYFMIGEESEKKDIDEETALENNPRLTESAGFFSSLFKLPKFHAVICTSFLNL